MKKKIKSTVFIVFSIFSNHTTFTMNSITYKIDEPTSQYTNLEDRILEHEENEVIKDLIEIYNKRTTDIKHDIQDTKNSIKKIENCISQLKADYNINTLYCDNNIESLNIKHNLTTKNKELREKKEELQEKNKILQENNKSLEELTKQLNLMNNGTGGRN